MTPVAGTTPVPVTPVQLIACENYASLSVPQGVTGMYWRLIMNFNNNNLACLEVRHAQYVEPSLVWRTEIPCKRRFNGNDIVPVGAFTVTQSAAPSEPPIVPAAGGLTRTIYNVELAPGAYYECRFNLKQYLTYMPPDMQQQFGVETSGLTNTQVYSYFAASAVVSTTTDTTPFGTLVSVVPMTPIMAGTLGANQDDVCDSDTDSGCLATTFSVASPRTNTVSMTIKLNGQSITAPDVMTFTPGIYQGWWSGLRRQGYSFDHDKADPNKKLDERHEFQVGHLLDQATRVEKFWNRHDTQRLLSVSDDSQGALTSFQFWPRDVVIYIGGGPGLKTFTNAGLNQILIDPAGGGVPDGGG